MVEHRLAAYKVLVWSPAQEGEKKEKYVFQLMDVILMMSVLMSSEFVSASHNSIMGKMSYLLIRCPNMLIGLSTSTYSSVVFALYTLWPCYNRYSSL